LSEGVDQKYRTSTPIQIFPTHAVEVKAEQHHCGLADWLSVSRGRWESSWTDLQNCRVSSPL